jgi:hypothetical protein
MARSFGNPSKIILQTDDVVFSEIVTFLNLDEYEEAFPGVQDTVSSHPGNVYRASRGERNILPFHSNDRFPFHDHPVFVPLLMLLVA